MPGLREWAVGCPWNPPTLHYHHLFKSKRSRLLNGHSRGRGRFRVTMNTDSGCETALFPRMLSSHSQRSQSIPTEPSPPAASNTSKEETSHHQVSNSVSEAEAGENDFTANGHGALRAHNAQVRGPEDARPQAGAGDDYRTGRRSLICQV